jgi:hypothetical protein
MIIEMTKTVSRKLSGQEMQNEAFESQKYDTKAEEQ